MHGLLVILEINNFCQHYLSFHTDLRTRYVFRARCCVLLPLSEAIACEQQAGRGEAGEEARGSGRGVELDEEERRTKRKKEWQRPEQDEQEKEEAKEEKGKMKEEEDVGKQKEKGCGTRRTTRRRSTHPGWGGRKKSVVTTKPRRGRNAFMHEQRH